jgi:hypothetical protein
MWDHKIDMKEGFEPKSFKNYNLTPEEEKELDKFLINFHNKVNTSVETLVKVNTAYSPTN